jgi:hypothetical protein
MECWYGKYLKIQWNLDSHKMGMEPANGQALSSGASNGMLGVGLSLDGFIARPSSGRAG